MTSARMRFAATCLAAVSASVLGCMVAYAQPDSQDADIDRGKEIYHEKCAVCHGVDGVPILPGAPEFAKGERLDKPEEELLKSIQHGKGMMPAWKDTLSAEERKDALRYATVLVGDRVFEEKCLKCHTKTPPKLRSDIPKDKELGQYAGPLDICKACNVEEGLTREETLNVIKFLRSMPK